MEHAFRETLQSGKFVVTSEIGPPKGTNIEPMLHHIDLLKDRIDGMNVTDNQSSVMRYPSVGGTLYIKERGGEPILQMTCRDRNRLALQADILFAYSRGVRNILCLTGDAVPVGDHKEAKGVFDLDSVTLLQTIRTMETGKDLGGNDLDGTVDFCAGAIVTPEANPIEPQMIKFEKKVEAGAEFIQTQAIYDMENFKRFMEYARKFDVKILAGIILLTSQPKGTKVAKGIEIAGRMVRQLNEEKICDGVHIMAIGKEEVVPDILAAAGL